MATFTKRISANLDGMSDQYNSHWSPTWKAQSFIYGESGNVGSFTEWQDGWGDWYGGLRNASWLFKSVTIPQGATITSAKVTLTDNSTGVERTLNFRIIGVDEDNTGNFVASPISTCRTRTHTTAVVDWDSTFTPSSGTTRDLPDITDIIQEIVNRGGWSSGNTIGLYFYDDGSSAGSYYDYKYYSSYPSDAPILTITYEASSESSSISSTPSSTPSSSVSSSPSLSGTPSSSPSSSQSITPSASLSSSLSGSVSSTPSSSISATESLSPSASPSITHSASISATPSSSNSPSPSPEPLPTVKLKIAKEGFNALTEDDPNNLVFDSDYETLKYHLSGTVTIEAVVDELDQKFYGSFEHNLGYIPYFEAYVQETDGGTYLPVPFMKTGGSTAIWYSVYADTTRIYFEVRMMSYTFDTYSFPFKYFIFKNSLGL